MIPKVSNVDALILSNNNGQATYNFKKVIFHKDAQFLLLHQGENYKVLKTRYDDEHLKLIDISNEEFQELSDLRLLDMDRPERDHELIDEYSVTGISFNKQGNESGMFVEYKFASIERPLDIYYRTLYRQELTMSYFQNDTSNFITAGQITVKTLVRLGLVPVGQSVIPNQFYEKGWGRWLPMPNITLLPYFSYCIASGLNKSDIIRYLKKKTKPNTFINFSIRQPLNGSEAEKEEYELLYEREIEVRRRLKLNGYEYPTNTMDVVNLYVKLGLAIELKDEDSTVILDLIVWPLAQIDSILSI
ncbi:DUF6042 family protein [Paenibacillus puerhi]|uniref:DUF6042 family protein n=1 Tax=Paenibacillus puerhi TaxID=2692622 RepID=UPI001358C306|nr:DUF6042 family protein [Paenibacillus puerhi]